LNITVILNSLISLEIVLFSAEFKKGSHYLIKKTKILIITSIHVCILGRNKYHIKRKRKILDCIGITKGLTTPSKNNLIVHYKNYHDKEIICDFRDDLIRTLQRRYYELSEKNLPIYGVTGAKTLKQYCSTDRDLVRGMSKIPGPDHRLWDIDLIKESAIQESTLQGTAVSQGSER